MEQMLPPYASGILSIVYLKLNKIRLNLTIRGAMTLTLHVLCKRFPYIFYLCYNPPLIFLNLHVNVGF